MVDAQALTLTPSQLEKLPLPEAEAALAALVQARRVETLAALVGSSAKPLAKAAKKALYQLRSQGVVVPEAAKPQVTEATPAAPAPAKDDEFPALLSAILGTGERAAFFVRPRRGGGLDMFQVVMHDEQGIVQFGRGETNRNAWRSHLKQVGGEVKAQKVAFDAMRVILGQHWPLNAVSKTPLPEGAESSLRQLGVEPIGTLPPLPSPSQDDVKLAGGAKALHDEPEIAVWFPGEAQLAILGGRFDEVTASPLALTDEQKKAQFEAKALQTAQEALAEPSRHAWARRLWAMADYFEAFGRTAPAALARAEAKVLFHHGSGSAFLDALYLKVIELTKSMPNALPKPAGRGAMPPPPNLVTP